MRGFLQRYRLALRVIAGVLALLLIGEMAVTVVVQQRLDAALKRAEPQAQIVARVGGFPVSVAVARNELGMVHLRAGGLTVSSLGRELHVTSLDATAFGVHNVRTAGPVRIDSIHGTVALTWLEISAATGANLTLSSDGTLRVSGMVSVLGERMYGELMGTVALDEASQQIVMLDPVGMVDGVVVPSDVLSGLIARLSARFTLPTVPGFTWMAVRVDEAGVRLDFRGDDLTIPRR